MPGVSQQFHCGAVLGKGLWGEMSKAELLAAYFAEKLAEAELEAAKPDALWLDEDEFWSDDGDLSEPGC